jgi:hypothetical protein
MTAHAITLQLPESLYESFKRKADEARRTVEAEVLDAVAQAAPETDELPPDLVDSLAQLDAFEDEALWQLARSHISREESTELEDLHLKRQSVGLAAAEKARTAFLVGQYERAMVLRAHAARVLNERGHDVSCLLQEP